MHQLPESVESQIRKQKNGTCWLWYGPSSSKGYPFINFQGERFSARQFIWEVSHDLKLQAGKSVLVTCGNVMCVNPEHMRVKK